MSDTVYNVVTRYSVDDSNALAGQQRLATGAERLNNIHEMFATRVSSFSRSAADGFDRVAGSVVRLGIGLASAATTGAIALLVHGVAGLNAEAEEARISIAGMLQAGGAAHDFTQALGMGDRIIERMREHANALPGEFRDLMNVFQGGLLPGLAGGKTEDQVEGLAANFMAVSQTFRVDSQTAGRELNMILEGRAGSHLVMWSRLKDLTGKTAEQFNRMSTAERFDSIDRALRGFGPAIEAYGHSWSAVSSTARDHLKSILRIGTQPLFERVKATLERMNGWFERNQTRIEGWANVVGGRLVTAFDRVSEAVQRVIGWIRRVNLHEVAARAQGMAEHIGSGALLARAGLGLLSSSGAMGAVGSMVGGGALAGSALTMLIVGPIVAAVAAGKIDVTRSLRDLADAFKPVAETAVSLGQALKPLVEDIGVVLAQAIIGLARNLSDLAAPVLWLIRHIPGGGSPPPSVLTPHNADGTPRDDALATWLHRNNRSTVHNIGSDLGLGQSSTEVAAMRRSLQENANLEATDFNRFGRHSTDMLNMLNMRNGARDQIDDTIEGIDFWNRRRPAHTQSLAHERNPGRRSGQDDQHPGGNMHVTVRIEQTINDASDPDRVRIDTRRAIREALQQPIASHNAALPVGG